MHFTPNYSSQPSRLSLQLSIEPLLFSNSNNGTRVASPEPTSPLSFSNPPDSAHTTTSNDSEYVSIDAAYGSVLCMYDFNTNDPDQLAFSRNEILDIVKQEDPDNGWWAALRRNSTRVGWIPASFVQPLSQEMADKLLNVVPPLRVIQYKTDQLYDTAPVAPVPDIWGIRSSASSPVGRTPGLDDTKILSPTHSISYFDRAPSSSSDALRRPATDYARRSSVDYSNRLTTLSTPNFKNDSKSARPRTAPKYDTLQPPSTADSSLRSSQKLSAVALEEDELAWNMAYVRAPKLDELEFCQLAGATAGPAKRSKIEKLTGSHEAQIFHDTIQEQTISPWFLRPAYNDELQVEDGIIRYGTLDALIEKLLGTNTTSRNSRATEDALYRDIFLTTFRTFTTADVLFETLKEFYQQKPPDGLDHPYDIETWEKRKLFPTQNMVLTVFTCWLEDHHLLQEEPHIARRLTEFLVGVTSPNPLAITAKLIIQSIERLTFASPQRTSAPSPMRRRKKSKDHKNDLFKMDPLDFAEQLTLYKHYLYAQIRPVECIHRAKLQPNRTTENLTKFISTHEQLASWVKLSVLEVEALAKRSSLIEFWIKVAEKCRNINNFSSMSAIINALSSTVISKLQLTWGSVSRHQKSTLDSLLAKNEPTGGFAGYRSLLSAAEGPCVPFMMMFITDMVHINDQFHDETIATPTNPREPFICFLQRHRWYEVISVMLRHQGLGYTFPEDKSMKDYIHNYLRFSGGLDQDWFWEKSQNLQTAEVKQVDIRRGLEAAGF